MKILCVHPNFELYGSDRSFADVVAALYAARPGDEIGVLLPCNGPILSLNAFEGVQVAIRYMWALRHRHLLGDFTIRLWKNLRAMVAALHDMRRADRVYLNTIIAADFLLMARFAHRPVFVHVREIPSPIEIKLFRLVLIFSRATLIFNSEATRRAFRPLPPSTQTCVCQNGCADQPGAEPAQWSGDRPLRVLLIGRVNRWKGHQVLVDAVSMLTAEERSWLEVRMVGGAFKSAEHYLEQLKNACQSPALNGAVKILPFEADSSVSYLWSDIVVVPSLRPEPFGRVAIEAMSFARPVLASASGGLIEIVKDHETGRLFEPGNARDLCSILREFLADSGLVARYGAAGKARFLKHFKLASSTSAVVSAITSNAKIV